MKKILLRSSAALCLLWGGVAVFTSTEAPRELQSRWQQAADEAYKIETSSSLWVDWKDSDKLTVNRGTLSVLRQRAEWPSTVWQRARLFFAASAFFAFIAGASLFH